MKTFIQRFEELKNSCKTIDDWKKAYDILFKEACELNDDGLRMQEAIIEKYGEKALDELIKMAMDNETEITPAMKEMIEYGYTKMNILPIDKETAQIFFDDKCSVYMLYSNNTEKKINSLDELETFDGLIGIDMNEVAEKIASEAGFSSEEKEAAE